MSYDYKEQRPIVFTEAGLTMLLKIRDNAQRLTDLAGAVREEKLWVGLSGDSWDMRACVDYLVERGELKLVFCSCARQHNVYVKSC